MKRAAIYTRYSSDQQNDRSIEDQVVLCRAVAIRSGLTVIGAYEDRAMSGASVHGRSGLAQLMSDARAGKFEVVLVESLDRLSRDQEDLPAIFKRLSFLSIDIIAAHDGKADQMQVGIRAIVGAMYLTDLAQKVRRGLSGVIRDGRYAGGRAYGYQPIPGKPGQMVIVDAEAQIVRRIFAEYIAGQRARDIAQKLNAERVPPPRGRYWNQSTINGNFKRRDGILLNESYIGHIVWNRVRMVKDPDTGKRVSRINPEGEWQRAEAPHLRIVEQEIWDQAQAIKGYRACQPRHLARKPRELLSGLLQCHACGGGMSIKQRTANNRVLIVCTRHKEARSCANHTVYYLDIIERSVVATLCDMLRDRKAIKYYVDVYNAERREIVIRGRAERARLEMRLAAIEREYERTRDGYIKGFLTEQETRDTLPSLRVERDKVKAELAAAGAPPKVVSLHPGAMAAYLKAVDQLDETIRTGTREGSEASREMLRTLVHSVVVRTASAKGKVDLQINGRLAQLIGGQAFPQMKITGSLSGTLESAGAWRHQLPPINVPGGLMVAGERSSRSPHWPFQLLARAS